MRTAAIVAAIMFAAILSVALPWCSFDAFTNPRFPGGIGTARIVVSVLDLPVAVVNRTLPEGLRTHMTSYLRCGHTYCFPAPPAVERARYLRVGIPAYALLFTAVIGGFLSMKPG